MANNVVKEYSNGELTVIWKPDKCIHSGICVDMLPEVYDPEARPWITPKEATTEELKKQINECPSGALSYKMNNKQDSEQTENGQSTRVQAMQNGPLMVHGTLEVTCADGSVHNKSTATAFCRCGASANKPYCDGSHREAEFKD